MIVLTTPTGQIGSQVLGNLLDSGEELRVIVRLPPLSRASWAHFLSNFGKLRTTQVGPIRIGDFVRSGTLFWRSAPSEPAACRR